MQLENGFTRIANEILAAMAMQPLNGTQHRIIDVIWRYTYGFNRKEHGLSETFISKATNIHRKQIQRELNELISCNIIRVIKDATFSSPRILAFNKDYSKWVVTNKLPGIKTKVTSNEIPGIEIDAHTGSELVPSPGSELVPQERNILNKTLNKGSLDEFFESIWKLYPKKEGKGQVSKSQKQKLYKIGYEQMKRCVDRYATAKAGTDKKFLQNGSTFLNSGYLDYLDENNSPPIPKVGPIRIVGRMGD